MHFTSSLRSFVSSFDWRRNGRWKPRTKYVVHFAIGMSRPQYLQFVQKWGASRAEDGRFFSDGRNTHNLIWGPHFRVLRHWSLRDQRRTATTSCERHQSKVTLWNIHTYTHVYIHTHIHMIFHPTFRLNPPYIHTYIHTYIHKWPSCMAFILWNLNFPWKVDTEKLSIEFRHCHSWNEYNSQGKNLQTRASFMCELSIWRVRVASLTCLTTRHKKTCIDACQAREVFSPDQPRKTCQNLERTETK